MSIAKGHPARRQGSSIRAWRPWLAAPALLLAAGCGGEQGPPRQPVSGAIKLDGKPLPSGSITFAPIEGGAAATGEVSDGQFQIGSSSGPPPGHYQVEILAVRPTGKRIPHPDLPSETIEEVRNIIPVRYNANTELKVEVKPTEANAFTFDLSSQKLASRTKRR